MSEIQRVIWDSLLNFPIGLSSTIFYFFLYALCIVIWYILIRYVRKWIQWGYCAFSDIVVGNINNLLYQKTKRTIFLWIDGKLYRNIYHIENNIQEKRNEKRGIRYGFWIITIVMSLILMWDWLVAGGAQEAWSLSANPLNSYLQVEKGAEERYQLISRKEREKEQQEEIIPETEIKPVKIYYKLSKDGWNGAKIRRTPEKNDNIPLVTIISGEDQVEGLGEEQIDSRGVTWVKVKTEDGLEGWISKKLIEVIE